MILKYCHLLQRYSQSSVLKRTALELIAEDMLTHAVHDAAREAVDSAAERRQDEDWEEGVENLFEQAHFGESDHISRHQLSCALQSLGTANFPLLTAHTISSLQRANICC